MSKQCQSKQCQSSASVGRTVLEILAFIWLGLTTGAALIYVLLLRPRMLNWGATPREQNEPLPGDEIISDPSHVWTRGVSIAAPPEAVWPWLVQMGQGRGGLYSYDWLENLAGCDIHSVDTIVPELQNLAVGDEVRLVKPDYPTDLALEVAQLDPESALVLRAKGDKATALAAGMPYLSWAFVLQPAETGHTRLIARTRSTYDTSFSSLLWNRYALEPIQFIMERKMLLGIKARAEQWAGTAHEPEASETLIDRIFPDYEFRGIVSVPINAPVERIFQALEAVTLADMPLARTLGELRYLPGRITGAAPPADEDNRPFLQIIQEFGNIVLAETPGEEIVIGVAGKFHQITDQTPVHFDTPEQFHQFQDPAFQKLVQSFRVAPNPDGPGYLLTLEHRTHGLSAASRRAFGLYWLVIRPMGNFVTRLLLQAVKARAEVGVTASVTKSAETI